MRSPRRPKRSSNSTLNRQVATLDELSAFEEFRHELLPALQKDLRSGLTEKQIIEKYKAIAAARLVTHMASQADLGISLTATRDLLDRTLGKATERKDVTHRLSNLPEKEIDALLLTELEELESEDDDSAKD